MTNNPQRPTNNGSNCYLVTGAAGFIAARVCEFLLEAGHTVVGVDNLNDYYDVRLKDWRLSRLLGGVSREQGAGTQRDSAEMARASLREPLSDSKGVSGGGSPMGDNGHSRELGTSPKVSVFADSGAPGSRLPAPSFGRFTFHALDIENLPALEEVFKAHKFDAVFNLAARAGVRYSIEFPELYRRTNVLGEENVLKCQVKYGVKKQVLASSSSVYAGCPMPFTEDRPLQAAQSPYAETKKQAEALAHDYHLKHGLDITVLRYFTVFGPAGRPDMAPLRFIKWIDEGTPITLFGDGSQARDFTYVDDIARGTILAGKLFGGRMTDDGGRRTDGGGRRTEDGGRTSDVGRQPPSAVSRQPLAPSYEVINLGGGRNPISMLTVIGLIEQALYDRGQRTEDGRRKKAIINGQAPSTADMKETWANISKAKRLLGWSPTVSPEQGFKLAVDWHVANRDWLKGIKL
jgi:UDP-glucuronate 4-epimerase